MAEVRCPKCGSGYVNYMGYCWVCKHTNNLERPLCPICGSENTVRDGRRRTKEGWRQKMRCMDCGQYFTVGARGQLPRI